METIIDKLRTLQAAADILGVSVKDLINTHGHKASAAVKPGHSDFSTRAAAFAQQSEVTNNANSGPEFQYPILPTLPAQEPGSPFIHSGSDALLANSLIPTSTADPAGEVGACFDGAKPDLASGSFGLLANHSGDTIAGWLSPSNFTSQITHLPEPLGDTVTDWWPEFPDVPVPGSDPWFQCTLNQQDDHTGTTGVPRPTPSFSAAKPQFSHLLPHQALQNLDPIPFLDPSLVERESCAPLQTEAVKLPLSPIQSFPALWPDANIAGGSKLSPDSTMGSSPLEKRPDHGAGCLRALKSLPAPPGTGGLVQTPRKRKRRKYDEQERSETHITRMIGGCIACRSRRKRVSPACLHLKTPETK